MLQVGRNTLARAAAGGIRAGGARLPPAVGCVAAAPAVLRHDAFQGDMGRGSGDLGELGASDLADEADSRSRGPGRVTEAQRGPVAAADADSAADSSLRRLWRWASQAFGLTLELMGDLLRSAQLGLLFLPALVLAAPSFLAGNGTMQRWYSLFATTLEVAGPTFVKLGQWASTRPDLFPPDFCEALCRLHDGVGSHPLADARQLIEAELGAPLGQLFCVLNPLPLGTGSIAQVYEAVLCPPGAATEASCQLRPPTRAEVATAREEGRHVAVKVQHPGVRGRITQDLRLMHRAVAVVSLAAPSTHWFALREMAENFEAFLLSQLDFSAEAAHLSRFARNFADDAEVVFPAPIPSMCTPRVLVETHEVGASVRAFLGCESATKKQIAAIGLRLFLQMVLVDNFTHADLHPGNMLVRFVRPDGSTAAAPEDVEALEAGEGGVSVQLVLVDAGLVTELSPQHKRNFVDLFAAVARGQGTLAARLMLERSSGHDCDQPEAFVEEVASVVDSVSQTSFNLQSVEIGDILRRVLNAARKYRVRLDPAFTQLIVGIVALEGVGRQLDSSADIFSAALPLLPRADSYTKRRGAEVAIQRQRTQAGF